MNKSRKMCFILKTHRFWINVLKVKSLYSNKWVYCTKRMDPLRANLSRNLKTSINNNFWFYFIFSGLNYSTYDEAVVSEFSSCLYGSQHISPIDSNGLPSGVVSLCANTNPRSSLALLSRSSNTFCPMQAGNSQQFGQGSHQPHIFSGNLAEIY